MKPLFAKMATGIKKAPVVLAPAPDPMTPATVAVRAVNLFARMPMRPPIAAAVVAAPTPALRPQTHLERQAEVAAIDSAEREAARKARLDKDFQIRGLVVSESMSAPTAEELDVVAAAALHDHGGYTINPEDEIDDDREPEATTEASSSVPEPMGSSARDEDVPRCGPKLIWGPNYTVTSDDEETDAWLASLGPSTFGPPPEKRPLQPQTDRPSSGLMAAKVGVQPVLQRRPLQPPTGPRSRPATGPDE